MNKQNDFLPWLLIGGFLIGALIIASKTTGPGTVMPYKSAGEYNNAEKWHIDFNENGSVDVTVSRHAEQS